MVIACLALFVTLGGVGMAATGYRITSLWQIAPKVRHELHGAITGPHWGPVTVLTKARPEAEIRVSCAPGYRAIGDGFAGANELVTSSAIDPPDRGVWVTAQLAPHARRALVRAWVLCESSGA